MNEPTPILKPLIRKYRTCNQCLIGSICPVRIHYRGKTPCDALLIGEAVGDTEIAFGEPFVGKSGQLLDDALKDAELTKYRLGFTNSIICVPSDSLGGKLRAPRTKEIQNCSMRLTHLIKIVKPKILISVGATATRAIKLLQLPTPIHSVQVLHPSAILRSENNQAMDYARLLSGLIQAQNYLMEYFDSQAPF